MNPIWLILGGAALHALAWQFKEAEIQELGEALIALLSGKPVNQTHRKDAQGIPMQLYREQGLQYNPLFVAARAKRIFNAYMNNTTHNEFLRLTDWLRTNALEKGDALLFPYHFDIQTLNLQAPWFSCLAQAVALTCYAQRSTLPDEDSWLADCSRILVSLSPVQGLGDRLTADSIWFPEYATKPMVLNGMLAVLLELHTSWKLTSIAEAHTLFQEGYNALVSLLPDFDCHGFSYYSLDGSKASRNYHRMHIRQLRELHFIQPSTVIQKYLTRWQSHDRIPVIFQIFFNPRPKRVVAYLGSLAIALMFILLVT